MYNLLCGGMFAAMWNNFYNSIVTNVDPGLRGTILVVLLVGSMVCVVSAFKGGKEGRPIKNHVAFWLAIILIALAATYSILLAL